MYLQAIFDSVRIEQREQVRDAERSASAQRRLDRRRRGAVSTRKPARTA
ncbi:hypothetical protein [Antribacter gilvus]|nr:hypothetical protein [Antribacter gilvus]